MHVGEELPPVALGLEYRDRAAADIWIGFFMGEHSSSGHCVQHDVKYWMSSCSRNDVRIAPEAVSGSL